MAQYPGYGYYPCYNTRVPVQTSVEGGAMLMLCIMTTCLVRHTQPHTTTTQNYELQCTHKRTPYEAVPLYICIRLFSFGMIVPHSRNWRLPVMRHSVRIILHAPFTHTSAIGQLFRTYKTHTSPWRKSTIFL